MDSDLNAPKARPPKACLPYPPKRVTTAEHLSGRRNRVTGKKPPFRLTRGARTFSAEWMRQFIDGSLEADLGKHPIPRVIDEREEALAFAFFKKIRFMENGGEPFCPECGGTAHYVLTNRSRYPVFKCATSGCYKQYSVTSGTIFHSRKLPYSVLLKIVTQFVVGVKGDSVVQGHIKANCQYKSAYHNVMKLREAMASYRDTVKLQGQIEIDGIHIGGPPRWRNIKKSKKDDSNKVNKRVIMVIRQRDGDTVAFADNSENEESAYRAMDALILPGHQPDIYCDEAKVYGALAGLGRLHVVTHAIGFSLPDPTSPDGRASTNLAESWNSRVRRGERGEYHHFAPTWLDLYASEFAWRENVRRLGDGAAIAKLIGLALGHPVSRHFKGYGQRYLLPDAELKRPEVRWRVVFPSGRSQPAGSHSDGQRS